MKYLSRWTLCGLVFCGLVVLCMAHSQESGELKKASSGPMRSTPGQSEWNRRREPEDWWGEIVRYHGHVGPWNVLGWQIGKAAMREFKAQWGDHTLDIVVHLPLTTPYTCIADGLTVATGNSIGRLDIRLAEELTSKTLHVSIRSKTTGRMIEFWPKADYLRKIESRPPDQLDALARECITTAETDLFDIRHL